MSSGAVCDWKQDTADDFDWDSQDEDVVLMDEIERAGSLIEAVEVDDDVAIHSLDTLNRAADFLMLHASELQENFEIAAPVPNIDLGPNGSIDLHWKQANWELLVNIPKDTTKPASYYADDYGPHKSKGSFDPKTFDYGIAMWLTKD